MHPILKIFLMALITFSLISRASALNLPPVTLKALTGQKQFSIPNNFKKNSFVILGFDPKEQPLLEKCIQKVQSLQEGGHDFSIIEIPVIPTQAKTFEPAVQKFMRSQIKNKTLINFIYPWYTSTALLKTRFNLNSKQTFVLLVCNPQGVVLWQKTSEISTQDLVILKKLLAT